RAGSRRFSVVGTCANQHRVLAAVDDPTAIFASLPAAQVANAQGQLSCNGLARRHSYPRKALEFLPGSFTLSALGLRGRLDEEHRDLVTVDGGRVLDVYAHVEDRISRHRITRQREGGIAK